MGTGCAMRPNHPERGVTLIELVLAIVIVGIVIAAVIFFLNPLRQGADIALRAELTDIADNALQRIGRDVRLALPNSIRVDSTTVPGSVFLEFIAVRTAGRYRSGGGGPTIAGNCAIDDGSGFPDSDQLVFDAPDTCFTTLGKLSGAVAANDQLVLNNYGLTDQNAYQTAPILNRVTITSVDTSNTNRDRVEFGSTTFQRALHDSPGKRFFVISGPVTYECNTTAGTITRHDGYALQVGQPTSFGAGALIAENVVNATGCSFSYASVGPQLGLLTMQITLRRQLFGGAAETVSLYHAVHVSNAP
jgi:MSHA biogenesis protein MshO